MANPKVVLFVMACAVILVIAIVVLFVLGANGTFDKFTVSRTPQNRFTMKKLGARKVPYEGMSHRKRDRGNPYYPVEGFNNLVFDQPEFADEDPDTFINTFHKPTTIY